MKNEATITFFNRVMTPITHNAGILMTDGQGDDISIFLLFIISNLVNYECLMHFPTVLEFYLKRTYGGNIETHLCVSRIYDSQATFQRTRKRFTWF